MIFLSDFLRAEVVDNRQRPVGRVADLIADMGGQFPTVEKVVLRRSRLAFAWDLVRTFEGRELALKVSKEELKTERPADNAVLLARDVLDKQIIDTDGKRVVRVNDLQLSSASGALMVVGVDVGGRGLLRRLSAEDVVRRLALLAGRNLPFRIVSWDVVDPVQSSVDTGVKLKISERKLAKMHPADIADVVERLSLPHREAIIRSLDDETAADAMEELSAEDQADIIERLDDERAADILEEMKPDEAADLLADLPSERAEALLDKMEEDEADDVEELLHYEDDTAGGLMTTDYVAVTSELTAAQAIDRLRELEPEAESVYYVYVIDHKEDLLGVLSLRDLIVAKPDTPITDIMIRKVVSVHLESTPEEVAEVIRKYNLLAVPVTDLDGHLEGIVTVDDVMETVLAGAGRRRTRIFG